MSWFAHLTCLIEGGQNYFLKFVEYLFEYISTHFPPPPSSVPDPDPDPQMEKQEFRIRIWIRILDPDPSVTRDGEKKVVYFVYYEDKNGLKSLTF